MRQEGDVKLRNTPEGGEITAVDGVVEMDPGIATAVYLAWFGGNQQDPGESDTTRQWWGNIGEDEPARRVRSRVQHILDGVPATPGNLKRLEDAAKRDLEPMQEAGAITSVEVAAALVGHNRVKIRAKINGDTTLEFSEAWGE
jgi:phage gp46-like protein